MRIAVDIDGVLFPWSDVAREVIAVQYGIALESPTSWDGLKNALPESIWRSLWTTQGQAHIFGQTHRSYPDGVMAVDALIRLGHKIHFVTHRDPKKTVAATAEFLGRHFRGGPGWAGVHVIQRATSKWSLGPWDVLIDDKPETVFEGTAGERTMVFAPLRSWNASELEGADGPNLHVYTNPWDIVTWVERACCAAERRSMDGGCLNCGAPSL